MTAPAADPPVPDAYRDIADLLQQAVGEDDTWRAALAAQTRLDSDLFLDSVEMAAFADLLRHRYGPRVDLLGFVAELDIDEIIALSLAEVAGYVASRTGTGGR